MNVQPLAVTQDQAILAVKEYKDHRGRFDALDWQIERIYRAIAKGKVVISLRDAIVRAGIDDLGRPRLAIMRADQTAVMCDAFASDRVIFTNEQRSKAAEWHFEIPWPNRAKTSNRILRALLPRIPPQFRPAEDKLSGYHILWEADWTAIPRDPYLLKRIGKDAFVVVAAWDLTSIELNVLRAAQPRA